MKLTPFNFPLCVYVWSFFVPFPSDPPASIFSYAKCVESPLVGYATPASSSIYWLKELGEEQFGPFEKQSYGKNEIRA